MDLVLSWTQSLPYSITLLNQMIDYNKTPVGVRIIVAQILTGDSDSVIFSLLVPILIGFDFSVSFKSVYTRHKTALKKIITSCLTFPQP